MLRSMITAANTMNQLHKQLDTISHNMANVNTIGYKRRDAVFGEMLAQQMMNVTKDDAQRLTPAGVRLGVGAKIVSTNMQLKQGSLAKTDRSLDVALTKDGQFFRVRVDDGIQYTRNGVLYLSPSSENADELMLVNAEGYPILDEDDNPIIVTRGFQDIQVKDDGTMLFIDANGEVMETVRLGVTYVTRPQLLQAQGSHRFAFEGIVADGAWTVNMTGELRKQIQLQQYALEQSNVDVATEMTDLMMAQRMYQMNARSITLSDQMMGLINTIRS